MKKILFAGIATLALVGAVSAADLPRKMPVKAVPPAPMWNWTGFYLGGFYGTSVSHSRATSTAHPNDTNVNDIGFALGGTAGYNWQFNPNWLIGIEGDIGWLGTNFQFTDYNDRTNLMVGSKMDGFATARARFGYVTGPSLIYATGGGAWVRVRDTFGVPGAPTELTSTRSGWTVGGGIETKLTQSWTTKTEYLYIDVGSNDFATNASGGGIATVKNSAHVLKTGFNYQFGNGPFEMFPFFAKPFSSPERWAGFYAGVNAGGGISGVKVPTINDPTPDGNADINGTGFAGGGHIGYNMVVFSNWLVGVEGDVGYLGVKHSYQNWFNSATTFGVSTDWYSTLRGRIGTSTGPAFIYTTGGVAFAKVTDTFGTGGGSSISNTRAGWTLGGGIETELGPRWSARLEYIYMNLGKESLDFGTNHVEFENRFQVVRAGVSYKFGGPDVVTARY